MIRKITIFLHHLQVKLQNVLRECIINKIEFPKKLDRVIR